MIEFLVITKFSNTERESTQKVFLNEREKDYNLRTKSYYLNLSLFFFVYFERTQAFITSENLV